jgi:hypothetical protein
VKVPNGHFDVGSVGLDCVEVLSSFLGGTVESIGDVIGSSTLPALGVVVSLGEPPVPALLVGFSTIRIWNFGVLSPRGFDVLSPWGFAVLSPWDFGVPSLRGLGAPGCIFLGKVLMPLF